MSLLGALFSTLLEFSTRTRPRKIALAVVAIVGVLVYVGGT